MRGKNQAWSAPFPRECTKQGKFVPVSILQRRLKYSRGDNFSKDA